MRCGCPNCGAFMVQAEEGSVCVCPDCGYRCTACLGTNTVVGKDALSRLQSDPRFSPERLMHLFDELGENSEEDEDVPRDDGRG